jgi:hypothetical protein
MLGGEAKVNELAYRTGAFVRKREVQSPSDLLQMLMIWAVAERSLRETVALASEAGLAELSDVALIKRLKRAGIWIGGLLGEMLTQRRDLLPEGRRLRLIDATAIARVGHRGTDLRVHLAMDLGVNCVDAIEITDSGGAESLDRFTFLPGEIVLADRGYAHRKPLARLSEAGAHSSFGRRGHRSRWKIVRTNRLICLRLCEVCRKPLPAHFRCSFEHRRRAAFRAGWLQSGRPNQSLRARAGTPSPRVVVMAREPIPVLLRQQATSTCSPTCLTNTRRPKCLSCIGYVGRLR